MEGSTTPQRIVGSSELIVLINGFCFIHTLAETPWTEQDWDPCWAPQVKACFTSVTRLLLVSDGQTLM